MTALKMWISQWHNRQGECCGAEENEDKWKGEGGRKMQTLRGKITQKD